MTEFLTWHPHGWYLLAAVLVVVYVLLDRRRKRKLAERRAALAVRYMHQAPSLDRIRHLRIVSALDEVGEGADVIDFDAWTPVRGVRRSDLQGGSAGGFASTARTETTAPFSVPPDLPAASSNPSAAGSRAAGSPLPVARPSFDGSWFGRWES